MASTTTAQPPAPTPPDIRIVETAEELREATEDAAQDIEIRTHLDLRPLKRLPNPELAAISLLASGQPVDVALLYVLNGMRSMRGNCSDPGAAAALGLSSDESINLLPLKPRQCLLLLPDNFLMANGGTFWLDNLYLRLARTFSAPRVVFVSAALPFELQGPPIEEGSTAPASTPPELYITNVTMHGDAHGPADGVFSGNDFHSADETVHVSILIQDCIFTGWIGLRSPIASRGEALTNIVDTVFHDMHLSVEIVDVSSGGIVRFQNVSLANVTLTQDRVVSTSLKEHTSSPDNNRHYYPGDNVGFDVELTVVPLSERGMFGEEFVIEDAVMSDCYYLAGMNPDETNPGLGCPAPAEQPEHSGTLEGGYSDYADPEERVENDLLVVNSPWLLGVRKALGELPPPPATWPPFAVQPPTYAVVRDRPTAVYPVPPGLLVPVLHAEDVERTTLAPIPGDAGTAPSGGKRSPHGVTAVCAVIVFVLVIGALAAGWAVREVRRMESTGGRQRRGGRGLEDVAGDPLHAWLTFWQSDGMHVMTAPGAAGPHASSGAGVSTLNSASRREGGGPPDCNSIPRSAMNPDYEYALPTEIARMMGTPTLETVDEALLANVRAGGNDGSGSLKKPARRGRSGASSGPQVPSFAATQPAPSRTAADSESTGSAAGDRSRSAGETGWPESNARTAPLAATGGRVMRVASKNSLLARTDDGSDAPGSTVVLSPYDATYSTQNTRSMHSTHSAQSTHSTYSRKMKVISAEVHPHGGSVDMAHARRVARRLAPRRGAADRSMSEGSAGDVALACRGSTARLPLPVWDPQPVMHSTRMAGIHDGGDDSMVQPELRTVGSKAPGSGRSIQASVTAPAATAAGPRTVGERRQNRLIAQLQWQLDGFGEEDLFLRRFEILGRTHQRRGGHALVQFVEDVESNVEFAVKFFLDWDSFLTEAALYAAAFPHIRARVSASVLARADATAGLDGCGSSAMSQVLARCLPQVEAVCDSAGGLEDAVGRPLPPCIVLEKGESLLDWNDRAQPDIFTYLSVLSSLSQRLADMHDAGYVHRDLKPANIMWLPRQNRWTVLGFGCVARVGEAGPLSPTLAYAAPEVVRAYDLQEQQIEVTPALDVWSLGVMAFELLMGASAFNLLEDGSAGVMQRLRGDLPLPWEGELGPSAKSKLGAFKEPVLGLLQRDPGRRPTMRAFHATCNRLFARTT